MKQILPLPRVLGIVTGLMLLLGHVTTAHAQSDTVIATNPDFVEFGAVEAGDSTTKDFTISNLSDTTVTIEITAPGEPFYITTSGLEGGGSFTLTPGEERDIRLQYRPERGDTPPLFDSTTMTVSYETDHAEPKTGEKIVELRGQAKEGNGGNSGSGDGEVTANTNRIDFGTIEEDRSETRSVTLENNDNQDVEVSIAGLDSPFSVSSGGGTTTLEPGETRTVQVRFAPATEGDFSDTLLILYTPQGESSDTIAIPVSGRAIDDGDDGSGGGGDDDPAGENAISTTPGSIQFGDATTGETEQRTLMVTNRADTLVTGTVSGVDIPFVIISGGGSFSLEPEETLEVVVEFRPTAPGIYDDSVVIDYDAPDGNDYTRYVPLMGRAMRDGGGDTTGDGGSGDTVIVTDVLRPSTDAIAFGSIPVNSTVVRTIFLRNTDRMDTVRVAGTVGGANSEPFTIIAGGGPFTLGPGETRQVSVEFAPEDPGFYTDAIVIDYVSLVGVIPADTSRVVIDLSGRALRSDGGDDGSGDDGDSTTTDIGFNDDDIRFNDGDTIDLGEPVLDTIVVTNFEDRPVTVRIIDPGTPFEVIDGGGTFTLNPGESHMVIIRFLSNTAGTFADFIRFLYGDDRNTSTYDIVLRGIADDLQSGSVAIGRTVGGAEISRVWPNPTGSEARLALRLERPTDVLVELYDRTGELLMPLHEGSMQAGERIVPIAVEDLAEGTYFLRITLDGEVVTRAITVVR